VVTLGDEIEALVLQKEDAEGRLILSKKRAQYERAWGTIEAVKERDGVVKGGLILDIGLRGFLPASLVELRRVRDLQPYVGRELEAKIIELDKNRAHEGESVGGGRHQHSSSPAGSAAMNLSLSLTARVGDYALHFLTGMPAPPAHRHPTTPPDGRLDLGSCSPCDDHHEETDPDESVCKLSLILDERRKPRPHKGAFGYDFEPFM
jgi:hypothetical protein